MEGMPMGLNVSFTGFEIGNFIAVNGKFLSFFILEKGFIIYLIFF